MAGQHPQRARGVPGAFHRPVPPAGRADTEQRRDGRRLRLREGRHEVHRRRRLGRCVAARLLRLGIQEKARRPRRGAPAIAALCRPAGQSAATDRLRHRADRHPHQLDQRGHRDPYDPAGGTGGPEAAAAAEMGVLGPRPVAPGAHKTGTDRGSGRRVRQARRAAAGSGARPACGGAFRQSAGVLPVRRRCRAAAGGAVRPVAGAGAAAAGPVGALRQRPVRRHGRKRRRDRLYSHTMVQRWIVR
jgi:hypothetical protein